MKLLESFRGVGAKAGGFLSVLAIDSACANGAFVEPDRVATRDEVARCYAALESASATLRVVEGLISTSPDDLRDEVLERLSTAMGMSADGIEGSCKYVSPGDSYVAGQVRDITARQAKIAGLAMQEMQVRRASR